MPHTAAASTASGFSRSVEHATFLFIKSPIDSSAVYGEVRKLFCHGYQPAAWPQDMYSFSSFNKVHADIQSHIFLISFHILSVTVEIIPSLKARPLQPQSRTDTRNCQQHERHLLLAHYYSVPNFFFFFGRVIGVGHRVAFQFRPVGTIKRLSWEGGG